MVIIVAATILVILMFGPGWPCLSKNNLKWLEPNNVLADKKKDK